MGDVNSIKSTSETYDPNDHRELSYSSDNCELYVLELKIFEELRLLCVSSSPKSISVGTEDIDCRDS